jgi:predicted phosphodiesterase
MTRLFALSDLHVSHAANRALLEGITPHQNDWLILGGDLGETPDHLRWVLDLMGPKFARLLWVPGNHELWSMGEGAPRGQAKYEQMLHICQERRVLTPEDPYEPFPQPQTQTPTQTQTQTPPPTQPSPATFIAPLFLLYDYSFRPADIPRARAIAWATENGPMCADETYLFSTPHASRDTWCAARCDDAEARLSALPSNARTVLVNHFPLRAEHAYLPLLPRFSIWCGTSRTEDWHLRFRANAVVFGHCHMRSTRWRDGIPFEEVSLGYPKQWTATRTADSFLREIRTESGPSEPEGTIIRR